MRQGVLPPSPIVFL
ncbi:hypothetical protein LINPERHAP1_LOCUS7918 [Linum perenne]